MTGTSVDLQYPGEPRSTDSLEQLFEMSLDMLGTASLDGYLTRLNPAWERILGRSREELMAEPFLSFVHPDDVQATIATASALAEPGRQEVIAFANRYRTAAGDYRWLEWSATSDESTIYFVAKDVTARRRQEADRAEDLLRNRRSESRHRTLVANLPDTTVFLLDHELRILLAEGEAVRRLPWFSGDAVNGRPVSELFSAAPAKVVERSIESFLAVLEGEQREFAFASGGATFAVQSVPLRSDDGAVDAALVVVRDITRQEQLAEGLYRSEERLCKAEGMVGGGIWELALDGETMTWSGGLCRIHGATPVDGREPLSAYLERVDLADRAHFHREISRCLRTGRAAFEYRIFDSNGVRRTLTVETELVNPTDGRKPFVRGAALDVTDERAGFDAAPLAMLVAEPEELRLIRVNDSLCSLLGRSREQLLGQRLADLTHPEDRSVVADQKQILINGPTGTSEVEKRYLRPDGGVVWATVFMTALHGADGSVRAFSTHVIDITERRSRAAEVNAARVESLRRLAIAGEYRDSETYEHTERVSLLSVAIGHVLGMTESQLDLLRRAAPLHDIGKVGVPDEILLKPGRLTDEERKVMELHTLIGADILSASDSAVLNMAQEIALTHHERWDGQGYPHKMAAKKIPLVGRIVAIADVFDALTHERPYKEAWHHEEAVAHICSESGGHFDPAVVDAFNTLNRTALSMQNLPEGQGPVLAGVADFSWPRVWSALTEETIVGRDHGAACHETPMHTTRASHAVESEPEIRQAVGQPGWNVGPPSPAQALAPRLTRGRRLTDWSEPALRRAYGDALRAGDPERARHSVARALEAGLSVTAVQDRVIAPAMHWIGELWQRGAVTVGDEHLATAISQDALGRLYPHALTKPSGSRERIVLAAVQGEHHVLGLRMAADTLEGAGFDVLYLGADVPLSGLLETCRTHAPQAVGLTATTALNVPALIWEIGALGELDPPPVVFAAGQAVGAAIEQGLDLPVIDGVEQLVSTLETILSQPVKRRIVPVGGAVTVPVDFGLRQIAQLAPGEPYEALSRTALSAADAARDSARHAFAMEQLAYRDALTGLWNRRAYDDRYADVGDQDGSGGTILMVDLDRFKNVNDTHGHEAGDAALIGLADIMLRNVRPGDFVTRYGGDEFAILLPGADTLAALAVAERIRAAVQLELADPALSVSIGISPLLETQLQTSLAVDEALYEAREHGRDRIVVATPDGASSREDQAF